jgi:hypothetical protein
MNFDLVKKVVGSKSPGQGNTLKIRSLPATETQVRRQNSKIAKWGDFVSMFKDSCLKAQAANATQKYTAMALVSCWMYKACDSDLVLLLCQAYQYSIIPEEAVDRFLQILGFGVALEENSVSLDPIFHVKTLIEGRQLLTVGDLKSLVRTMTTVKVENYSINKEMRQALAPVSPHLMLGWDDGTKTRQDKPTPALGGNPIPLVRGVNEGAEEDEEGPSTSLKAIGMTP